MADYRVYELKITKQETGDVKLVKSTLDHMQYPSYNPVDKNEFVTYVQSWKCKWNFSNFSDFCANPKATNQGP